MLTLYQFEECPFCEKVRTYLDEHNLEYEKVNVPAYREDPVRKELAEKSGVFTVPVLKDGDEYIGDSGNIIKYLEEKGDK